MGHLVSELIVEFLPRQVRVVVALVGGFLFVMSVLSLGWTTWRTRGILRRSLGRTVRRGEDTSIKTWMTVSPTDLEAGLRELEQNPFELTKGSSVTERQSGRS